MMMCKIVQALKSGLLPADLNIGDHDVSAKKEDAKEDKMATDSDDKANKAEENVPEQKPDGPTDMEQVQITLNKNLMTMSSLLLCCTSSCLSLLGLYLH